MKTNYEKPQIEVIALDAKDVITTSTTSTDSGDNEFNWPENSGTGK